MDLIDRAALLKKQQDDADIFCGPTPGPIAIIRRDEALNAVANIVNAPSVPAVPLDALCEWLAAQDFTVKGEPICAKLYKETWKNVIRECVK